jgi:hypothetical protein
MHATGGLSHAVDLYNSATGAWTTAQLSVARYGLGGASVSNVAVFAGGYSGSAFWLREDTLGRLLRVVWIIAPGSDIVRL